QSFKWALEAEKIHARMYKRVKESVGQGEDPELGPLQVCSVCGHTLEGQAPEVCPICNTRNNYVTFS
ncbi:MAG: rubredoxin-like domain-containing protein, partial [Candidatus Bipolaricaulota bacterium]